MIKTMPKIHNQLLLVILSMSIMVPLASANVPGDVGNLQSASVVIFDSLTNIMTVVMILCGVYFAAVNPNAVYFVLSVGVVLILQNANAIVQDIYLSSGVDTVTVDDSSSSILTGIAIGLVLVAGYKTYSFFRLNRLRRIDRSEFRETSATDTSVRSRNEIATILEVGATNDDAQKSFLDGGEREANRSSDEHKSEAEHQDSQIIKNQSQPTVRRINLD